MQFRSSINWNKKITSPIPYRKITTLQENARPNRNPSSSEAWFVKIVCTLCFRYKTRSFLDVFNSDYFRVNVGNVVASCVVHRLCSYHRSPELAFSFFRFTRVDLDLFHSPGTCIVLIRSLCQMGFRDFAKLVFGYMKEDGSLFESSVFEILVRSFSDAGMFDDAKNVISEAENSNVEIQPYVYNNVLSLLTKKNRVREAVCFFQDCILRSSCYRPDTCTFNIVIQGLCKIGEVDEAFGFFNEMKSFNCFPDVWTYNALVSGFCRVGEMDRGRELLKEVDSGDAVFADVVTYTALILGYCKSGDMRMASCIYEEMIKSGIKPNLVTFNVLIDGFGKNHDMASALNMYREMLQFGFFPDVMTFSSLIDGYCKTRHVDQGLKLLDEMKARSVTANLYTFSILINALCKENRITEARDLLTQMSLRDDIFPQPFVYNPVIDGFCKAGNVDEANAIVTKMEANRCNPDKFTFTILIIGHCMKGRMIEAINIFHKMLASGCTPDMITVNGLVSRLSKAGMPNEAFKIKQSMSEILNLKKPYSMREFSIKTKMEIPVAA